MSGAVIPGLRLVMTLKRSSYEGYPSTHQRAEVVIMDGEHVLAQGADGEYNSRLPSLEDAAHEALRQLEKKLEWARAEVARAFYPKATKELP